MKLGKMRLRVFIGYQLQSDYHHPGDFRRLGREITTLMTKHKPSVHVMPSYGEFPVGAQLWESVLTAIEVCDVAILDISENNPNVLLEAGLAFGTQKLVVLLRCSTTTSPTPADVNAFVFQPYDNFVPSSLARSICSGIKHYLRRPKDHFFYFRHLWSLEPGRRTYILPGILPGDYSKNPFEDYIRLRNHTDLDSLFLVAETLTRLYPQMTVLIQSGSRLADLPDDWRESNLVLVGGPDYNPLVKEFERVCPLEYKYRGDTEVWLRHKKTGQTFVPSFKTERGVRIAQDYGFFLKTGMGKGLPGRLVFIGGARTWGVYGASMLVGCRGFLGETSGARNVQRIVEKLGSDPSFVVTVRVTGSTDGVHSPYFRVRDIEPLPASRY